MKSRLFFKSASFLFQLIIAVPEQSVTLAIIGQPYQYFLSTFGQRMNLTSLLQEVSHDSYSQAEKMLSAEQKLNL